jgi:hypothetical protein
MQQGAITNELRKAMAVADMKFGQRLSSQNSRSALMRTVMPAAADAALKVSAPVICREHHQGQKVGYFSRNEKHTYSGKCNS